MVKCSPAIIDPLVGRVTKLHYITLLLDSVHVLLKRKGTATDRVQQHDTIRLSCLQTCHSLGEVVDMVKVYMKYRQLNCGR